MARPASNKKASTTGHYLHEWRIYSGETLESLAEKVGMTHGAIHQLETGKTSYRQQTLEKLADAFGCKPSDILDVNPMGRSKELMLAINEMIEITKRYDPELIRDALDVARQVAEARLEKSGQARQREESKNPENT